MQEIIYCRYSTTKQHDGVSIETQIAQIEQVFKIKAENTKIIIDRAKSGGTDKRPGYQELKTILEKEQVRVYIYRLDRLHRNLINLINFQGLLLQNNSELRACDGSHEFLGSPDGELVFKIQGLLAEHERQNCAIRTKNAMEYIAQQGKHPGGRIPFGVSVDSETREYYYDENINVMKEAFILYYKKCYSIKEVEEILFKKFNVTFTKNYLEGAFNNSFYYGYRQWAGSEIKVIDNPLFTKDEIQKMKEHRHKIRKVTNNYYTKHDYKFKNVLFIDNEITFVETQRKRKSGKVYKYYRNKTKSFKTTESKLSSFLSYLLKTVNQDSLLEEVKIAVLNDDFTLAEKLYKKYKKNKYKDYSIDQIQRIDIDTSNNTILVIYNNEKYEYNNLTKLL